jgi:hypothetical protein
LKVSGQIKAYRLVVAFKLGRHGLCYFGLFRRLRSPSLNFNAEPRHLHQSLLLLLLPQSKVKKHPHLCLRGLRPELLLKHMLCFKLISLKEVRARIEPMEVPPIQGWSAIKQ